MKKYLLSAAGAIMLLSFALPASAGTLTQPEAQSLVDFCKRPVDPTAMTGLLVAFSGITEEQAGSLVAFCNPTTDPSVLLTLLLSFAGGSTSTSATIDQNSLTVSTNEKDAALATITGTATGVSQIGFNVGGGPNGGKVYYSELSVGSNGQWSATVGGLLPGLYQVEVDDTDGNTLTTGTLLVNVPGSLTPTQIQAIINLLQSFNANSVTITDVFEALNGMPQTFSPTPVTSSQAQSISTLLQSFGASQSIINVVSAILNGASNSIQPPTPAAFNQSAFSFNGTNQYATLPQLPDSQAFTVSAWVNYAGGNNCGVIFSDGDSTPGNDVVLAMDTGSFYLRADKGGAALSGGYCSPLGAYKSVITTSFANEWHHVVWVQNGVQSVIYLDGTLHTQSPIALSGSNIGYHNTNAQIGRMYDIVNGQGFYPLGTNYFQGDISDLRYWNLALTPAQVSTLYTSYGAPYNPSVTPAPYTQGQGVSTGQVVVTSDASSPLPEQVQISTSGTTNGVTLGVYDLKVAGTSGTLRSVSFVVTTSGTNNKTPEQLFSSNYQLRIGGTMYGIPAITLNSNPDLARITFHNLSVPLSADVYIPITLLADVQQDTNNVLDGVVASASLIASGSAGGVSNNPYVVDTSDNTLAAKSSIITSSNLTFTASAQPSAPRTPTVTCSPSGSNGTCTISWNAPSGTVTGYEVSVQIPPGMSCPSGWRNAGTISANGNVDCRMDSTGTPVSFPATPNTTYWAYVEAQNNGNWTPWSAGQSFSISAPATPTATLTASATSITAGQSSTVTWSSTNATYCTLTTSYGSMTLTNTTLPSGSGILYYSSPNGTHTYSIVCTGAGGTSPASTITVTANTPNAPPTITSISPSVYTTGQSNISMTVYGSGFSTSQSNQILLDWGTAAGVTVASPVSTTGTSLTFNLNASEYPQLNIAGTHTLEVRNVQNGQSSNSVNFTVTSNVSQTTCSIGQQPSGSTCVPISITDIQNATPKSGKVTSLTTSNINGSTVNVYSLQFNISTSASNVGGTTVYTSPYIYVSNTYQNGSYIGTWSSPLPSSLQAGSTYVVNVVDGAGDQLVTNASLVPSVGAQSSVAPLTDTLAQGWTGPEVVALQGILHKLDFYSDEVTGYFGTETAAAVEALQTKNSIDPTGIVGPTTRALLKSLGF